MNYDVKVELLKNLEHQSITTNAHIKKHITCGTAQKARNNNDSRSASWYVVGSSASLPQ